MPVFRMLYVSGATRPMTDSDLDGILAASRRNNARDDITGVLLWADGAFIQVLEGEEARVRKVAARIRNDLRHRNFMVLVEGSYPERAFGSWSMGYKRLEPGRPENDALFRTSREALAQRISPNDTEMVLEVVTAFAADFMEDGGKR
jgi:hypothetical protein